MDTQLDSQEIGSQLGADGVNGVVGNVEEYCTHEETRITLENHAPVVALRAELALLVKQAEDIEDRLREAPPPGDLRHFKRKKIFAGIVAVVLTVTGFFLAVLTLAPFRLGWPGYLFALGIATVVPFLVERLLEDSRLELLVKALTAVALLAGMVSLMLLADVRGQLLAHEIESPPAVVLDDAPQQAPADDFYSQTLGSLRLATVLLSFAMELGAGLALREAWTKAPYDGWAWQRLCEERAVVHGQMISVAAKITRLEDEPGIFAAQLWRDFYKAMLAHTVRNAMRKLLIVVAVVALVPLAHAASTPPPLDLVVALDLSKSVDVKGPDGKTEFEKDVGGVAGVLAQIPAGSRVTVIGITDHSFAQPYLLLSASVPADQGYFGERLSAARRDLVQAWKQRSARLQPKFSATDILGALELGAQIFSQRAPNADRRVLILFSDMKNDTRELDLENSVALASALKRMSALVENPPNLHGVVVFVLGVDGAGSTTGNWRKVQQFWKGYFARSGATLEGFSVLRGMP
jgi:hypothetical protein